MIDEAQKNIAALSGQVVSLQGVLSEQAVARRLRPGAQMEAIVARPDGDQFASYEFQFTLSNGKRPDCVIRIPSNNVQESS